MSVVQFSYGTRGVSSKLGYCYIGVSITIRLPQDLVEEDTETVVFGTCLWYLFLVLVVLVLVFGTCF